MKFIMILFLCINDPFVPIESTCVIQSLKMTFNSMEECQLAAKIFYKNIKDSNIYMTSFCAEKNLTSI
jgi:hypothetical protein